MDIIFFVNSLLLGVGLAMDAFSVCLANGLTESRMKKGRMLFIAGIYAFFQALMPIIGWAAVHTAAKYFNVFKRFIPYIALLLLAYIGIKMLLDGIKNKDGENDRTALTFGVLFMQGIATSIDALSVGFTISDYDFGQALVCALLIAAVTYIICMIGLVIGKKFGTVLSGKASVLGGIILIGIGLEIFIKGVFF